MISSNRSHPQKVRTFAADLDAARIERQHKKAVPEKTPPIKNVPPTKTATETGDKAVPEQKIFSIEKKKSELSKSEPIIQEATIIKDTKRHQTKLLPAVGSSLNSWFKNLTTKKKRSEPQYVVPESNRRHGVIQQATSKSGALFTADNQDLKEQIRRRRAEAALAEEETDVTWSPYTEPGYILLESADGETTVAKTTLVKQPESNVTETQTNTPVHTSTPATVNFVEKTLPPTITTQIQPPTPVVEVYTNSPETKNGSKKTERSLSDFISNIATNTLTLSLVGLIAISTLIILLIKPINNLVSNLANPPTDTTPTSIAPILSRASIDTITLTTENLSMTGDLIIEKINTGPAGVVEYALISANGNEITPSYIFQLLNFRPLPTLKQSLTNLRVATINHSKPIFVAEFVDQETVRGSMFDWETKLAEDMALLYNIKNITNNTIFTDKSIGGVDVRVLSDEQGTHLVYGFISEHTIIISTNESDFTQIMSYSK